MIVSNGTIYSIKEIVDFIIKIINYKGNVIFDKSKPEGILKKNTNNNIFRQYFPDFKFTHIEEGLTETIEYFIKNYDNVRK
jgi:GDP-L-fucose synthase